MRYLAAFGCAALVSLVCSATPAISQTTSSGNQATPIGKVQALSGSVKIQHSSAIVVQASTSSSADAQPKVGDPVYEGDIVETGPDSKLAISFIDGSAFNLSSNARMTMDQYVYDPKGASNSTLFNLSKGAFTFIAGQVARTGDMKVNTPVATMGIRGTAPHVEVRPDGTVSFSTLLEENKNAAATLPGRTPQDANQRASKEAPTASELAEKKFDKRLNICRGC